MLSYRISSRVPVCATLGRAGLRAGTCAVRRGARVTPPVTDSSVAPQDNLPAVSVEKTELIAEAAAFVRILRHHQRRHRHSTINDNQQQFHKLPPLSSESPLLSLLAREPRADGRHTRVHTCGRKLLTPYHETRVFRQYAARIIAPSLSHDERDRTGSAVPVFPRRLRRSWGRAGPPIVKTRRRTTNRCRAVSRNRERRAASTRSFTVVRTSASSPRRADVSVGTGETARTSQGPRHSRGRSLGVIARPTGTTWWRVPLATGTAPIYGTIYSYLVKDGFDWTSLIIAIAN